MSSQISTFNNGGTSSIDKGSPNVININKAIIMSDLHLGYAKSNVTAFMDFLTECISKGMSKEYSLFIIGDLWDLWRRHDIIYSDESDQVLSLINQFKDVYYLPGNHDHITLEAAHNILNLTVTTLTNTLESGVERRTFS